jgi:glucose-1-phosphate thymidylyltransferase
MKSLILAAGYATRLYPLTKNFPKPLLEIQNISILDRLIADLDRQPDITGHIIVSNHKFIEYFRKWQKKRSESLRCPVTVLDDGSTDNDNRLGAVKDIVFALEQTGTDDTLIVLAGDNILDFSLAGFITFQREKKTTVIMRHYENDPAKLRRTGVLTIADDDRVLNMQEKPVNPQSCWACPPFYIYIPEDLPLITRACQTGCCGTDAPGDFIAWFCKKRPVHAWLMSGHRYDIGTLESYEAAQLLHL